jgi:hypothetical protein
MKITEKELDILLDVAANTSRIDSNYSKFALYYFTSDLSFDECYKKYFSNQDMTKEEYRNIVDFIDRKYLSKTKVKIIIPTDED